VFLLLEQLLGKDRDDRKRSRRRDKGRMRVVGEWKMEGSEERYE
jgi:hypothetical protein